MFTQTYKILALHNFTDIACSYKDKKTTVTIISDKYTVPCWVCSHGLSALEQSF